MPALFEECHEELPVPNCGIYWFAGNPLSQRYNRILDEQSVKTQPSTIAHHLRAVLNR